MDLTLDLEDLDSLIDDLETQVNEVRLPERQAETIPSLIVCTQNCTV
ncbi:hypothetical protein [Streptoalloteichus hindustanus]|uniref:Uncharacterized protein n=1 Tax=Streptoalloteichus hindustanus TaxID=2017 RepID=A0A1M5JTC6_STRHI|nr:hypothetical protein [Streptoalloteichus hindustanus]SHG43778.1 hypothetical protein SAMN05444320_10927 [Streptoalloteichus hindustanus]